MLALRIADWVVAQVVSCSNKLAKTHCGWNRRRKAAASCGNSEVELVKDQIIEFLIKYPIAWIAVLLLVPLAIRYRIRRFKRATSNANDARSITLLVVGFVGAVLILWLLVKYT